MIPLFPTAYLPPVAYMARLAMQHKAIIERHETYPKQTLRNRAVIATAGGPLALTVPVTKPKGSHTATGEVIVNYNEPWNIRHIRAIESAYRAAPFFQYYWDVLRNTLLMHHQTLIEMNMQLLGALLKMLKADCDTKLSNFFMEPDGSPNDHRSDICIKRPPADLIFPPYCQVFSDKIGFLPNASVLDLLFCLGPEATGYLQKLASPTKQTVV
ncbi:MAG: WbqC family protein [Bacteroidales bacterium]|nr:WbqC family protein [Bacteroidales bacterium]